MAMLKSSVVQGSLRVTDTTYTNDLVVGDLTAPTIKNGDYLLIADADNGNKVLKGPTFDGSTATQALTKKGTWATFNNYSHPSGDGNLHVPATGTGNNGKFLKAGSTAGSISWSALPTASTSAAGIVKLDSATGTGETTAVTPKGAAAAATAAIQTLDSTLPSGSAASKTLTALTITDGKMTAATFSNISIGAGAITSGTVANARLPERLQEYHTALTDTDATFTSGWHYSNTNSPFTKYHSGHADFMIWAHAHTAAKWGSEIATDFRSNRIAVRNINNGTWNSWKELGSFTGPVNEYSWTSDIIYDDIENEFTNTRATNSWASQVYSKHGFADGCYVSFRPVDTTHYIMIGLNSDPTVDANWEKLDYAWYIQANGNIDIRESKTTVQSITGHTTYAANDDFRIEYSNGYIRYYHNGALCRTAARAISGQLYLDSTFYNGGSIKDLRFGPIKNINLASKDAPGLVPKGAAVSSQSTSTKFLREDGSWAAPSYIANAAYGNLSTAGKITTAITLATDDFLIIGDNSDGGKIGKGPAFNTSNTTKWLTQAGTWTTPTAANVGALASTTKYAASDSVGGSANSAFQLHTLAPITIQTGSTKKQPITLETLMTWLITTKKYIPSNSECYRYISTTWAYANNDILQLTCNGINYELQLAGCVIEFWGTATSYNAGMFRLGIHSSPSTSFTATSGYTIFPTSSYAEYTCNGSGYSPTWRITTATTTNSKPTLAWGTTSTIGTVNGINLQVTAMAKPTKSDVGLGNVEDTALSTWAGTNKITTVGTITSGTWNGTAIGITHGGTGKTTAADAWTALGGGASGKHADSYFVKAITSTDGNIPRFDGTGGQLQSSRMSINDNGLITLSYNGEYPGDTQYSNAAGKVGEFWLDTGHATNVTSPRFYWRVWRPKATAATTTESKYEQFRLPAATAGTAANATYEIITTKNLANITSVNGATFAGTAAASYVATFSGTTDATSSAGAVIVSGGLLVKKKLYVTTAATMASTLTVTGNTTLNGKIIGASSNYGSALPTSGQATGEIFFQTVDTIPFGTAANYDINTFAQAYSTSKSLIPIIHTDGGMEVGKYIDFHSAATANVDYDFRFYCSGAGTLTCDGKLYGAVWNDYAEYRQADSTESGRVVIENGNDTLTLSTARLQPGAEIISDTFGFAIGQTDRAKTPIATSGRVLAYPYESREEFKANIGKPVCSGPNGTVSIMTQEEYEKYGYCAIGTISAVPDYEEWGSDSVAVNGRVWIRVK